MAAMKVHGSLGSTATMRTLACLCEKDLPFEFVTVNMSVGDHKKPAFISLNPFGQVPVFEDGNLALFESRAINQYLVNNYADSGNELLPKDAKKRAIATVWMEVESQKFDPTSSKLVWELGLKPMWGKVPDDAVVEEFQGKLGSLLDVYEARLAKSKYLGGESFSLADLHHLPNLKYLTGTKVKQLFDARPHVRAWVSDIQSRPAWLKVISM